MYKNHWTNESRERELGIFCRNVPLYLGLMLFGFLFIAAPTYYILHFQTTLHPDTGGGSEPSGASPSW